MLFNSTLFLFFFAAVSTVFFALRALGARRLQKLWLLLASYAFYGTWNPLFVFLLLFSTVVDFAVGLALARTQAAASRRAWLVVSLTVNFGLLGFFKYANFFASNLVSLGLADWRPLDIVLPVGISFYTFQTLSYTIDVYRGRQGPCRSLLDFTLYVSFFPQLVAGPIVRAGEFLPQLERLEDRKSRWESGLRDIVFGLFKKVVLADTLGTFVDPVFAAPGEHSASTLLLAAYAYTYQIYYDFSGYSDMAIGLAAILGFKLPINFNHPYSAINPADFWRRWHITLSTWLRDYLFVPLGANGGGLRGTHRNLFLTMLLGGLWHGAGWNYVLWGGYHGGLLVAQSTTIRYSGRWSTRFRSRGTAARFTAPLWLRRIVTFHLIVAGLIIFRIETLADLPTYFAGLLAMTAVPTKWSVEVVAIVALSLALQLLGERLAWRERFVRLAPELQAVAYALATLGIVTLGRTSQPFIYFQF